MKHVSVLIPLGHTSISNIESTHQLLGHVNGILKSRGKAPLFDVQFVGLVTPTSQRNNRFAIKPDVIINQVNKTDLIIIPAMIGNPADVITLNNDFIPWIKQQHQAGAEVASYCVGAFFLAATGLLNGKQCATHWFSANSFRQLYPQVNLVDDKIITDDGGIYTSGGAFSYLNLLVHLIEKFAGREIAVLIAKSYMIDIDRNSQSPFIIFNGQKEHNDGPVKNVQEYIETNLKNKITIDQLSDMAALGRRSLERRFKHATGNTITEYVQRVKIEAAKKDFETSSKNIQEVMFGVGYNDLKGFRTLFKKITGLSPLAYRSKYNKAV